MKSNFTYDGKKNNKKTMEQGPKNCLIHIQNYGGPNVANKLIDRFKSRDDLCLLEVLAVLCINLVGLIHCRDCVFVLFFVFFVWGVVHTLFL